MAAVALVIAGGAYGTETKQVPAVTDPSLPASAPAAVASSDPLDAAGSVSVTASPEEAPLVQPVEEGKDVPWPKGIFADVTVGTQGLGMDVGYSFNKYLKLRMRGTVLQYDRNDTWSDVDVKSKLRSHSCGLILDVHPFGGAFRLSAGVNAAPMRVEADGNLDRYGDINGTYSFGGYEYRVSGVGHLRGRYKWNSFQPYFGFGWSCSSESKHAWYFTADLGVNIMGKGKLSVGCDGDVEQKGPGENWHAVNMDALESSIREEGKDFFEIADKIVVYPVLHFGVGCKF